MPTVDLSRLPEVINDTFYPLFWDKSRYQVLVGGAGSGKSHYAAMNKIARCVQHPNNRTLVIRKVGTTLRNSVWQLLKDKLIEMGWWGKIAFGNETEMRIRFLNGSSIICAGLDDVEKMKSIEAITDIWIEETTELVEDDFIQLDIRLRGKPNVQILATFNPISYMHWLKTMFFDTEPIRKSGPDDRYHHHSFEFEGIAVDALTFQTTYLDNRFIDPVYKAILEHLRTKNHALWLVYAKGEWAELEGLIYPDAKVVTAAQWPALEWFDEIIYGLDFGFNHKMALIQVGIKDGETWEKSMLHESGVTLRKLRGKLPDLLECSKYEEQRNLIIYADSADPGSIEEIAEDGWNIFPCVKGQGSVYAGLIFCKGLTTNVCEASEELVKEYRSYMWAKDRLGNTLDEPVKFRDDGMDAVRYAKYTHMCVGQEESFVGTGGGVSVYP